MAVDDVDGRYLRKLEKGEDPGSKHKFSLGMENERAHVGRNGRPPFPRPTCQTRKGTEEKSFSLLIN